MNDQNKDQDLPAMTTTIVAAYLANKQVAISEVPTLISQVYQTLASLGDAPKPVVEERPEPAVSVRKSITPDYLICLEDGKKLKMLKRHLKTSYNLTPEEYRERWGLPSDYPMVAPNYAVQRSKLAKQIGLGTVARRRGG
ncbi:MAG: MucR family transcriptional regulator [Elsteraceae bacterium]